MISNFVGQESTLENLKQKHKVDKARHRKLIREANAAESLKRDTELFTILDQNSTKVYKAVRAGKGDVTRKISKLSANGRCYTGESVPDGFFDSLLELKSFDETKIQDPEAFNRYEADYENIIKLCSTENDIPRISLEDSTKILRRIRPNVNDYHSVTANHFLHAGETGINHFHLLLEALIEDINNITIEEVNTVHAAILFKGHSKDKTSARSYRTISTCPLVAKALDMFIRDLNINSWNLDQAPTQFLGEGSSHELAALLLTEVIQHSLHVLHQPLFVLYLDAKSAFDKVIRQLLIRNLYFAGTEGKSLLYIDNRLEHRKTYAEWDKQLMGPIMDELGTEQGGVSSGDFYKIYGKSQLHMAQTSSLGVQLSRDLVVSAIGQADDTLLVSNSLHSLQNLLQLSLYYCSKYNVELCPGKTKLQVIASKKMSSEVAYLKEFSPVVLNGIKLKFHDSAEHVGIIRSVSGNLPNILDRISSHKKAVSAVLHSGAARHHRANPAAGLKLEQVYGFPVLLSGLGSLVLSKAELSIVNSHHKETLQHLLRLLPRTPQAVYYFLAGSLPGEALVHLRQFSLLAMISCLPDSPLYKHALNVFTARSAGCSWFHQVRDLCLQYQLPHPLTLLDTPSPLSKETFKKLAKKQVTSYWELKLREEASPLTSLRYFKPAFMSLSSTHPLFLSAGSSPYEVVKAGIQAQLLSGRYRTESLCKHWSKNPNGNCLGPSCAGKDIIEDEEHVLLYCQSLAATRMNLVNFTIGYTSSFPLLTDILLTFTNPNHPKFFQFLLDCSVIPQVISLTQEHGTDILCHLFKVTRTWCYSLHHDRLKMLGRWLRH